MRYSLQQLRQISLDTLHVTGQVKYPVSCHEKYPGKKVENDNSVLIKSLNQNYYYVKIRGAYDNTDVMEERL
jgi:uncharacterized pyridoxamine 5'-phosphate oxidase family protein